MEKDRASRFTPNAILAGVLFIIFCSTPFFTAPHPVTQEPPEPTTTAPAPPQPDRTTINRIETFVQNTMKKGKIPGLAVVIVRGEHTIYEKGFGFADLEKQTPVTSKTLFELGSTSKAFTALAAMLLVHENELKTTDPVGKYLPWLTVKHRGQPAVLTVGQVLYQTGGIPFKTIGNIPPTSEDDALEKTVRTLINVELSHEPGTRFSYATINYDIIGLLIQTISGSPYEVYMTRNILRPLGLTRTYLSRREAGSQGLATGYKLYLGKTVPYNAPMYRGNIPAGYIMTNTGDMARWMKIQTGSLPVRAPFPALVAATQGPNPAIDSPYAMGWIRTKSGQIAHDGANPNYTSSVLLDPTDKTGITLMTNTNSGYPPAMARGILQILRGKEPTAKFSDFNTMIDNTAASILYFTLPIILLLLVLFIISLLKILKKKKHLHGKGLKGIIGFALSTGLMIFLGYQIAHLPHLMNYPVPWSFVKVWAPKTFIMAAVSMFFTFLLAYIYFLSLFFFSRTSRTTGGPQ